MQDLTGLDDWVFGWKVGKDVLERYFLLHNLTHIVSGILAVGEVGRCRRTEYGQTQVTVNEEDLVKASKQRINASTHFQSWHILDLR